MISPLVLSYSHVATSSERDDVNIKKICCESIENLIRTGSKPNDDNMYLAIVHGHIKCVQYCIENRYQLNEKECIHFLFNIYFFYHVHIDHVNVIKYIFQSCKEPENVFINYLPFTPISYRFTEKIDLDDLGWRKLLFNTKFADSHTFVLKRLVDNKKEEIRQKQTECLNVLYIKTSYVCKDIIIHCIYLYI
jgi:hypothetical protein